MIIWRDVGIVLHTRPLQENSTQLYVFTQNHGRYSGAVFGQKSAKKFQPGLSVVGQWKARLPEHMGSWSLDIASFDPWVALMQKAATLRMLNAACALYYRYLPERQPYPTLYLALQRFFHVITSGSPLAIPPAYVTLQVCMMQALGYRRSPHMPLFSSWDQAYDHVHKRTDLPQLQRYITNFWKALAASA